MRLLRSYLGFLLCGPIALALEAQDPLLLGALRIGPDDTLLIQQYVIGCRYEGHNWVRITRDGDSTRIRYRSNDTTWIALCSEAHAVSAVSNLLHRLCAVDEGCYSTTTDQYLVSFNFRRLTLSQGQWYVSDTVDLDDVLNDFSFSRQSCGGNEWPWFQFAQELVHGPLQLSSKEEARRRRRYLKHGR
jgi:hypothetical protein